MTHLLDMPRSPLQKKMRFGENSHFEPLKWRFGKIGFVFKGVMFRFHISFWGCRWNWPTDTEMFFLPKLQWSSRDRWWKARGVLSVWAFFWATDWLDLLGRWHLIIEICSLILAGKYHLHLDLQPPPSSSYHQDFYVFSSESLKTFICHCYWVGGRSKVSH